MSTENEIHVTLIIPEYLFTEFRKLNITEQETSAIITDEIKLILDSYIKVADRHDNIFPENLTYNIFMTTLINVLIYLPYLQRTIETNNPSMEINEDYLVKEYESILNFIRVEMRNFIVLGLSNTDSYPNLPEDEKENDPNQKNPKNPSRRTRDRR